MASRASLIPLAEWLVKGSRVTITTSMVEATHPPTKYPYLYENRKNSIISVEVAISMVG